MTTYGLTTYGPFRGPGYERQQDAGVRIPDLPPHKTEPTWVIRDLPPHKTESAVRDIHEGLIAGVTDPGPPNGP